MKERNLQLYNDKKNGATFSDLAKKYNITTCRCRQIYHKYKRLEMFEENELYRFIKKNCPDHIAIRIYNPLRRYGISEIKQLRELEYNKIIHIRCIGVILADEIMKLKEIALQID